MKVNKMEYLPRDNVLYGNGDFNISVNTVTKTSSMHWHDYFECEFILSGNIRHKINNRDEYIGKGSAYLLSYFDSHSVIPEDEVKLFKIQFNENLLPDDLVHLLLLRDGGCCCRFDEKEFEYITGRIERIVNEDKKSEFYIHMMTALITELILIIVRKSGVYAPSPSPSVVQQAQTYAIRHFREHISLKSVAESLSITPKYLGSIFKSHTNMFFNEYLNGIRLRYACNLLKHSDISVKEIAYDSGYSSVEYFLDVFKRSTGLTPTQYRKNIIK